MTVATNRPPERSQKAAAKFAARRKELAQAALSTLSRLGYARSSLREIAQNSEFSHGVLHYYFKDKTDLIICSIREFKIEAIERFEATLAQAHDLATMLERMDTALEASIRSDGATNRFWYDVRAQALFDTQFRADVLEIYGLIQGAAGRFLERIRALTGVSPPISAEVAYAIFDGLFQRCMLRHAAGEADAIGELQGSVRAIIIGLTSQNAA